jgi:undecaprenyl-diphosphatase
MKLSWSHKLFFRINQSLGGRPVLEKVMFVSAHWLIYVFFCMALLWAALTLDAVHVKQYIKLLLTAFAFALATSYTIAIVWPHKRPVAEFPTIRQLLIPLNTWKSFPSDHTLLSFVLVFVSMYEGAQWYVSLLFFFFATCIAVGRVYVGVHYPRDIVGGFVLALLYSSVAFWLLGEVTQPMYEYMVELLSAFRN